MQSDQKSGNGMVPNYVLTEIEIVLFSSTVFDCSHVGSKSTIEIT